MFVRTIRPTLRRATSVPSSTFIASNRALTTLGRPSARRAPSWNTFVGAAVLLAAVGAPALQVAAAPTKEPATGISFDDNFNGVPLIGVGVRYKWGLVKIYAVRNPQYSAKDPTVLQIDTVGWELAAKIHFLVPKLP